MLQLCCCTLLTFILQGGPKETRLFFTVNNFATVNGSRKVCDMSAVLEFCCHLIQKKCQIIIIELCDTKCKCYAMLLLKACMSQSCSKCHEGSITQQ